MLKSKRKQLIMASLERDDYVTLDFLTTQTETSESTIRRDLDELEAQGLLTRVHGGAERRHYLREELSNQQKSVKNAHDKALIAKRAAQLIEEHDVVFIDSGTTTEFLIDQIMPKDITVVTNSIHHAARLVDKGVKTIIIGGMVKIATDASIGQMAIEQISRLNLDKAFIGMNGVDDAFLTTPDLDEAAIKRTIMANSQQTFILADASKLGQKAFIKVDTIDKASLITSKCDLSLLQTIKKKMKVIEV
ncbi:DeoR/GlpR family DNA-binding transcription regulator [Streptococcus sp. zg-JUN1979]|uniref:DeoR/GlpR family DNA-binding transcription regulator n=1 Tax=Streptococcus sp. zg-JUN1979 TaxID=3391450 RepID=UPI0039A51E78